jgi:hypothetical protein
MPDNPYFENISEEEIVQRLTSFEDLEIETMSIEEIQETIGDIILGYNRTIYRISPTGLTRARINNNTPFVNTNELWMPDYSTIEEALWKYGRCNDKGENIFYASSETDTVICEIRPENNSYITIVDCIPTHGELNALVHVVGVNDLSSARNDFRPIFENHYNRMREENGDFYRKNLLIDNFITKQFTQIVSETESWRYKTCIAITRILLSTPDVVGIIYPSIAANSKGANFVFKPDFANANLQIIRAGMFEVVHVNESSITVRLIMSPQSLCTSGLGEIRWKTPERSEMTEFTITK